MTFPLGSAPFTPCQRAVLAAWPAFEAAAAVKWCNPDRLAKLFYGAASLADLSDDEAAELATLMSKATTRLHTLAPQHSIPHCDPASPPRGQA